MLVTNICSPVLFASAIAVAICRAPVAPATHVSAKLRLRKSVITNREDGLERSLLHFCSASWNLFRAFLRNILLGPQRLRLSVATCQLRVHVWKCDVPDLEQIDIFQRDASLR